ncbi:hypothetical protein ACOME3_001085 [Neoechinorhynchus agilis]
MDAIEHLLLSTNELKISEQHRLLKEVEEIVDDFNDEICITDEAIFKIYECSLNKRSFSLCEMALNLLSRLIEKNVKVSKKGSLGNLGAGVTIELIECINSMGIGNRSAQIRIVSVHCMGLMCILLQEAVPIAFRACQCLLLGVFDENKSVRERAYTSSAEFLDKFLDHHACSRIMLQVFLYSLCDSDQDLKCLGVQKWKVYGEIKQAYMDECLKDRRRVLTLDELQTTEWDTKESSLIGCEKLVAECCLESSLERIEEFIRTGWHVHRNVSLLCLLTRIAHRRLTEYCDKILTLMIRIFSFKNTRSLGHRVSRILVDSVKQNVIFNNWKVIENTSNATYTAMKVLSVLVENMKGNAANCAIAMLQDQENSTSTIHSLQLAALCPLEPNATQVITRIYCQSTNLRALCVKVAKLIKAPKRPHDPSLQITLAWLSCFGHHCEIDELEAVVNGLKFSEYQLQTLFDLLNTCHCIIMSRNEAKSLFFKGSISIWRRGGRSVNIRFLGLFFFD